ncbi:MAG: cobalamin adenosyltransferase [Alkaliphilus sp.]|nr:cobalamin adenosyltransferase [bacterium AH-315-L21]MBN4056529.1 cobalamin adenosyltransferase [bacterium AH-315-K05]PHS34816.1 MAG: cobalamin adenosyltransferase [Alkaliphilus sp.]
MRLITEALLRSEFKKLNNLSEYHVDKNCIVTPSARAYLKDRKIMLVFRESKSLDSKKEEIKSNSGYVSIQHGYVCNDTGEHIKVKPEHMTQVFANRLVTKDHPRIVLRGKLDSLQSKILEVQIIAEKKKCTKLLEELEEGLNFTRNILRAEVLEEELAEIELIGLNEEEIRKMSHNPKKHFGIEHILPHYKQGELTIRLNSLRSSVREVELQAIKSFRIGNEIQRLDIIRALNRLSSCIYIMMLKNHAKLY